MKRADWMFDRSGRWGGRAAKLTTSLGLATLIVGLTGCAPASLRDNPTGWPTEWAGRTLYATPNALIYAQREEAAGELDRLVAWANREFLAKTGGSIPRPLIIVHDEGESSPAEDGDALLTSAMSLMLRRESLASISQADVDKKLVRERAALGVVAAKTGTNVESLYASMPLECDARCVREIVSAPEGIASDVDSLLILPSKARLQENTREMTDDACRHYNIGPLARLALAPVVAIMQARCINNAASARKVALDTYWAFRNESLSPEQARRIAASGRQRILEALDMEVEKISSGTASLDAGTGATAH